MPTLKLQTEFTDILANDRVIDLPAGFSCNVNLLNSLDFVF